MGYSSEFLIDYSALETLCAKEVKAIELAAATAEQSTGIDAADFWGMLARCDAERAVDPACLLAELTSLLQDDESLEGEFAEQLSRQFATLLNDLEVSFQKRTEGLGLRLRPLSPDADFGECVRAPVVNEPIDPFVFVVTNMFALTPAGERLKHIVTQYQWFE